jgi:hypothetical protein
MRWVSENRRLGQFNVGANTVKQLAGVDLCAKANPVKLSFSYPGMGKAATVGALSHPQYGLSRASGPGIRHFDMPATPMRVCQALQGLYAGLFWRG